MSRSIRPLIPGTRSRPGALGAGLLALLFSLSGPASATEAPRSRAEAQVLRGLALGEDVSAAAAELAARESTGGSVLPPRSQASARLGASFESLAAAASGSPDPARLASLFESFEAQDLLVRRELSRARGTLEGLGLGGEVLARLERTEAFYLEASDRLRETLGTALDAWRAAAAAEAGGGTGDAAPSLAAAEASVARAAAQVQEILARQRPREPVSLLRAAPLPYRRSQLGPRSLQIPQTIQPSYLDPLAADPASQDLAPTVEAPLSEAILRQAQALGYDPVAIFEFVRNSIAPELYAGAMKGAEATLRQGSGNDVDQASLLIALLRASRVPARYVRGVVELAVEGVAAELGLADPQAVPAALGKAGLAFRPVIRGGRVAAVEVEQTWVAAFVPYTNYRGAVVDFSGRTWVPLAPAVKATSRQAPTDVLARMGFVAEDFESSYLSTAQLTSPLSQIRRQVEDFLVQEAPGETYEGQLGSRSLVAEELGLLPSSLPMKVVAVTEESPALRPAEVTRVRVVARAGESSASAAVLDVEVPLSQLVGQRVTLSYTPAAVEDHRVVNAYGGLYAVPVFLVRLRPQLKVSGRPVDVGEGALDMGIAHRIEVEMRGPWGSETVSQTVLSGSYHALGLGAQKALRPDESVEDPGDTERLGAQLLGQIAHGYSEDWRSAEEELAGLLGLEVLRPLPSLAVASLSIQVDELLGLPFGIDFEGVTLDAGLRVAEPLSPLGDATVAREWMKLSGLQGSALEHLVFKEQFQVESISADRGLGIARDSGIEVLRLDASNLPSELPTLAHPQVVKDDVANWVRLGLTVEIPRTEVTLNAWRGSVWRAQEASTGSAGYFIAGALAGGSTSERPDQWVLDFLADALGSPYSAEPNSDPLSAVELVKIPAGDGQEGVVGEEFDTRLGVVARDEDGRPVVGAAVEFAVVRGGGTLLDGEGVESDNLTVPTNELGIAEVILKAGTDTSANPWYLLRNGGDQFSTQALMHFVEVAAPSSSGNLVVREPFAALAFPGDPAVLRRTDQEPTTAGDPGTWSETALVAVEDEFGNPVSNVPVTFSVGSPTDQCDPPAENFQNAVVFDTRVGDGGAFEECGVRSPLLGDCGGGSLTRDTSRFGAAAGFILGNASGVIYRFQISAPGVSSLPVEILGFGGCRVGPLLRTSTSTIVNSQGENINAARPGQISQAPLPVTISFSRPDFETVFNDNGDCVIRYKSTRTWERTTAAVNYSVSNGGASSGVTLRGDGSYEGFIRTGLTPGINEVQLDATDVRVEFVEVDPEDCGESTEEAFLTVRDKLGEVFGLEPTVERVIPEPVLLTDDGLSATPVSLAYQLNPASYPSRSVEVDIFQDGVLLGAAVGDSISGSGSALLSRGLAFDIESFYEAEVVANRGSVVEVRGERIELPLFQRIFTNVSESAVLSQEIDVVNERICTLGAEFTYSTTQQARVSLTFDKISGRNTDGSPVFGASTVLIDDELVPAGDHELAIRPEDLLPGEYFFTLLGTATADGHTETRFGFGVYQFRVRNSLPVGHAMYKGVDLLDGHLVVSRQDLAVPGRGVHLELLRAYSSNGGMEAGPFGVGWSHNYDSKVIVTPCGEAIVVGSAGSGMTFVDDGAGGLTPLRGHHGTLIANPADKSFDFFSIDGTRYHYSFRQGRTWDLDFIEDVNGNQTDLSYDETGREPRLVSVSDPAGRNFAFTYEERVFTTLGANQVITEVTGPDGLSMTYEYDDEGNLVSARREGGILDETYIYPEVTPASFGDRHRLIEIRDEVRGSSTTYTYDEGPIGIQEGFQAPSTFVASMTEPEGGTTRFEFDLTGLAGRDPPTLTQRVRDRRGNTTTYVLNQYGSPLEIRDPLGNRVEMTWPDDDVFIEDQTDANGATTDFTYDENGNLLRETLTVTDVDGTAADLSIVRTYKAPDSFASPGIKNRVANVTDRNGVTTRHSYDERGNITRRVITDVGFTETHTYDARGDRRSTTDANGNTTTFNYDSFGNLISVTDPLGATSTTKWDTRGRVLEQQDRLGRITRMEYDDLNRVVRTTFPDGTSESNVYDDGARTTTVTDPAGRVSTTTFDREGRPIQAAVPEGLTKVFEYDDEGNKTLESNWFGAGTPRADTTFSYDSAGRLTTRTEPLGRITTYGYDAEGNVIRETLSGPGLSGPRVTEFEYDELNRRHLVRRFVDGAPIVEKTLLDGEGNILAEEDPLGRRTDNEYDGVGRLISTADAAGNTTTFTYDAVGNLLEEEDPLGRVRRRDVDALGRIIRKTDAEGNFTSYEWDPVGNLLRQIDPRLNVVEHEYDSRDRRIRTRQRVALGLTPPGFVSSTFAYDEVGNQTEIVEPNGNTITRTFDGLDRITDESDDLGTLRTRTYDGNGNVVRETDANGNVTTREFDLLNRLVQENLPGSRTQTFTHDVAGNVLTAVDPNGETSSFEYDGLDRLVEVVEPDSVGTSMAFVYDAGGNLVSLTDRRGETTSYTRDLLNRVTSVEHPLGLTESFSYDAVGNRISHTDRRGIVTSTTYDRENRILTQRRAGQLVRQLEYDRNGNIRFDTDANGNVTGFEYDERNLKVAENRPSAAITRFGLDAMGDQIRERDPEGRVRNWTFDVRQRITTLTDGTGSITTFTYDGNGNQTSIRKPEGGTWSRDYDFADRLIRITDPLGNATEYGYDATGNRTSLRDARDNTTTLGYDALSRLTSITHPDGATLLREYDGEGNLLRSEDPKGQVVTFDYDALGRQVAVTAAPSIPSTGDDLESQSFSYDGNNNLLSVTEVYGGGTGTRTTTFTYDDFDRLGTVTDPQGKTLSYTYDGNGNRIRLVDPDGRITTYRFDALNRVSAVTIPVVGVTNYTYFRNSRLRTISYPNGTSSTYSYDLANRPTRVQNNHGAALVSSYEYTYDLNGNRLTQVETNGGAAETTTYRNDLADRLFEIAYPDRTTVYTYDGMGNRLTEQDRDTGGTLILDKSFDYDLRNRLLTVSNLLDPAQDVTYTYDANGNQTSRSQGAGTSTFLYDVRDQLTEVRRDGTLEGRYLYDHQGLRVRKAGSSGIFRYVYDDQSVLLQTDDAGNTIAKYDYGPDRLLSLAHVTEGRQFYLFDALGSISNLTRPDGAVQARYKYDAWGNPRSTTGASFNPFGFTGHERDDETGLYYFKARFYDPEVGRFLTEDPAEGDVTNPPSLHKYLYAHANPTVMVDPDGRLADAIWDIASIGLGVTSLVVNIREGNWGSAALDAFGVVVDTAAAVVPFVPGGVGVAIKASRAAKKAGEAVELAGTAKKVEDTIETLQTIDAAANAVVSAADAAENFENGEYGWGTFNASMAALGVRQVTKTGRQVADVATAARAGDASSANKAAPDPPTEVKQNSVVTGEAPRGGTDADVGVGTKSAAPEVSADAPKGDTPANPGNAKADGDGSLGRASGENTGGGGRVGDGGGRRGGDGADGGGGGSGRGAGGNSNVTFDPRTGRYRDNATGRFVARADVPAAARALETDRSSAFFWTGNTDGIGGKDVAAEIAESRGGVTIGTLMAQRGIPEPVGDFADPAVAKQWEELSREFAKSASGDIRAVVGADVRAGNIWEKIELPTLQNNPAVTSITTIDPVTLVETVIFQR